MKATVKEEVKVVVELELTSEYFAQLVGGLNSTREEKMEGCKDLSIEYNDDIAQDLIDKFVDLYRREVETEEQKTKRYESKN